MALFFVALGGWSTKNLKIHYNIPGKLGSDFRLHLATFDNPDLSSP